VKNSLLILGCFAAGLLLATRGLVPSALLRSGLVMGVVYWLLLLVGLDIGASRHARQILRQVSRQMLVAPLVAAVGTLTGVVLASIFLPSIRARDALAVGAGFGYYSLSSILVTQLHGEALGVVTLLANILRELLTLVGAPFMARLFGPLGPVVAGGATAMDTTLPVIVKTSGLEYTMVAVWSGLILSLLVPFLIPLLF
jgi:uncharacterized membrane protein YbjE (DUF340 family)